MEPHSNYTIFLDTLRESLDRGSFLKATLSKPPAGHRWKRIHVSAFLNSRGHREISFEYFDERQTERKNLSPADSFDALQHLLTDCFRSAYVRTENEELSFEHTDRGTFRLRRSPSASQSVPVQGHNREKHYTIPADAPFLVKLGISSKEGVVRRDRYDKFRQIQKFIEIIASLVPENELSRQSGLRVVDFGSGKHYLTFALHYFLSNRGTAHSIVGVEQRPELVDIGKATAAQLGCTNLTFTAGTIEGAAVSHSDLVVALHACDTATDDAIAKAIELEARYICVAPCCHSYVRQRLSSPPELSPILKHGILADRFADSLTDSLRVLLLESLGYQTKLFEFIAPEHTAKNTMITAVKATTPRPHALTSLCELRDRFQLGDFYLDRKLKHLLEACSIRHP